MNRYKYAVSVLAFFFVSQSAHAAGLTVPYTFTANTPAVAREVNANFNALTAFVNSATTSRVVTVTNATGVGSAVCASDEVVTGGGCTCTGSNTAGSNFGVTFACTPAGNAFVGGCFNDASTYNPALLGSPVEVRAICTKSQTASASAATSAATTTALVITNTYTNAVSGPDAQANAELQRIRNINTERGM